MARQEITLGMPEFCAYLMCWPLHREIQGETIFVSLHNIYVLRSRSLHKYLSANCLCNDFGRGLVHRIAAFAFAFAMAISRCQWQHRCVVTLGKFLVVLYSKPLWRKEKWKQRPKGDVCDVKITTGDAEKQGRASQRWRCKKGVWVALWKTCVVHRCVLRCSVVVH